MPPKKATKKRTRTQAARTEFGQWPAGAGALSRPALKAMEEQFQADPAMLTVQNAVTSVSVEKLAVRRDLLMDADPSFSIHLDDWEVTNQQSSGRCWMFAGLNLLRTGAMKKMKIKNFEFSQNYVMFWDKLEKANQFLECILDTRTRDVDDRTVAFLLQSPVDDGGQWNMFVNVIKKHGLVPKAAMPETESSSNTRSMNARLRAKLRQAARMLRDRAAKGASLTQLRRAKQDVLAVIYRILCIHLGTPPTKFDWQWREKGKDHKFRRDAHMTPKRFAAKYVTLPLDEYVCLVNDPRPTSPYERTFTVKYLGSVVGGAPVIYLNVDIDTMKRQATRALKRGEPVWFGCDVGQQLDGERGLWDAELKDYERVYGTDFALDKAARLQYGAACMTHAMLFTGVDLVGGKPRRWRVENSWGKERGKKGFYLMNDSWFDEHMFEIAARKRDLPKKLQAALDRKPIVLPPWDPMGSLAQKQW